MALVVNIYDTYKEDHLIMSTQNFKAFTFSTQLPGGFYEGSFTLPKDFFVLEDLKKNLPGRYVVVTDEAASRVYEGSIEGIGDADDGLTVQMSGPYQKGAAHTVYLAYPTVPIDLIAVVRELCGVVDEWRTEPIIQDIDSWTTGIAQEFMYETKIQQAFDDLLKKENTQDPPIQFAVYDEGRPFLFKSLKPWYKVARNNLTLKYGSTLSVGGLYNRIQVLYEQNGEKRVTNWYEDTPSQDRYGTREGTINVGEVPAGVAAVSGELAIGTYSKPDEQETMTIPGTIYTYDAGLTQPAYWLRAGHILVVSDIESNPNSRKTFWVREDQATYLVVKTSYTHDTGELSVEVGDGRKSFEQYLMDMGVSGGSVQ